MNLEPFHLRYRRLRDERSLIDREVSELSGIAASHISELANGRSCPTIHTLLKLAPVLGLTSLAAWDSCSWEADWNRPPVRGKYRRRNQKDS